MKRFALIGAAGFVAARHLRAVHETGHDLVAAMDKFDSVGILDNYFPEADFFIEFERFDRHLEKLKREGAGIDYLSVCTPNYLHDAHVRFGLRHGASVVCEKPLVLNPWNLEALAGLEKETGRQVYTILQLRLHPDIAELKERTDTASLKKKYDIDLEYITPRGHWYQTSWKGDLSKSGGIATNIGIHFFDMLIWIFGKVQQTVVHLHTNDRAAGYLELEHARVRWFLSINAQDLPPGYQEQGRKQFRSIKVSGEELEFSNGFTDLHTKSYKAILDQEGFLLDEVSPSIQLVHDIRVAQPVGLKGEVNPRASQVHL